MAPNTNVRRTVENKRVAWPWECDLLGVTLSGMVWEFEIKKTLSDFKKDAEKCCGEYKHVRLARGDVTGPNRFIFVTLIDVVPANLIPEWAAWYEVEHVTEYVDHQGNRRPHSYPHWRLHKRKKGKTLHHQKADDVTINHLYRTISHRYWSNRSKHVAVR